MATIAQIKASVARNTSVKDSALLFITSILTKLSEAGTEEERAAIVAELEANADALAAAITQNTPSA